ncbi:MAG: MarR family transcriptional regulator [Clostridia bacterium]|nr:MarR family transcriptional regulator [Clostridia bacterium]
MELRELVCELISISVIHRYRISKSASKVGLYFGQPRILEFIIENTDCTQKAVAKAMHISPASAAVTLKRLEKAGFITRRIDTADSRKNHLAVTQKGVDALKEFRKICDTTDEDMFKGFTDEERETLHRLLTRLHKNLDSENVTREEISEFLSEPTTQKGSDADV